MDSIETIKGNIRILEDMASWEDSDKKLEALGAAISALYKQLPTKPIIKSYSPALCPGCKAELSEHKGDGYYKHYYNKTICECGQKLKWKDENSDED